MADDYIGRKMEDYLASRQRKVASHRPVYGVRPGTIAVPYVPRRVFITSGTTSLARAIIEAFRQADCRVAFCATDTKTGTMIAQQTGSRFYPLDSDSEAELTECMQRVQSDLVAIDVIVDTIGTDSHVACGRRIDIRKPDDDTSAYRSDSITLELDGSTDPTHIGRICVFLTEPASRCIADGLTIPIR